MIGYPKKNLSCFGVFCDFVSIHKHAKEELRQYPAILTSGLVNNLFIMTKKSTKCLVEVTNLNWKALQVTGILEL